MAKALRNAVIALFFTSPCFADMGGPHPRAYIANSTPTANGSWVFVSSMTLSSNTISIGGNTYMWPSSAPATGDLIFHLRNNSILYWGGDAVGAGGGGGGGGSIFVFDAVDNQAISTFTLVNARYSSGSSFSSMTITDSTWTWSG